jgi:hypothetical protein
MGDSRDCPGFARYPHPVPLVALAESALLAWVAGFPASVLVLLGVSAALRRSSTR